MSNKTLEFQFGYEVQDVSPLSHYYEEIIAYTKQLKTIGIRGDNNYLFYSNKGMGTAYYEKTEAALSAKDTYEYFSNSANRQKFFKEIDQLLLKINKKISSLEGVVLSDLPDSQLYALILELMHLDGWAFTYFLVTQPHRTKCFEDEIRAELRKRVATSRVDSYMTTLALSEKPTQVSDEQTDWLAIILESRKTISPAQLNIKDLANTHPLLYAKVEDHYQKYELLTVGDGSWWPSIDYFIDNLSRDYKRPLEVLEARYKELRNFRANTLKRRQDLIKELSLKPETVETIEFLAEIGHYRFNLRTNGWMPVIFGFLPLVREISRRFNMPDYSFQYLEGEAELQEFLDKPSPAKIKELSDRISPTREYLLLLRDGKYQCYYGAEAGKQYKKLVKPKAHSGSAEVSGNVAMRGKVTATVTVYNWGDDLKQKLEEIKKHPILVAGHTRPAMMPLIREAVGIITDEGGVTSHAAIVSRELGIPSVINTKIATKVFQTGDKVELDAENGTARKL